MNKLQASQSFSVDDIRRIRIEDDKRRSDMTAAELSEDISKSAEESRRIMEEIRKRKSKSRSTR